VTTHPAYGVPRAVTPMATVLLADNPGPMTLDGTNTWLLARPAESGRGPVIVVDPGPDDEAHIARVHAAAPKPALILITHGHADHTGGAAGLHALTGAPVRAADPAHCVDAHPLRPGETITAGGVRLQVLHTPGHTMDSVCFALPGSNGVLTGDTVLGRGTTVIMHPEGSLRAYLDSLGVLAAAEPGTPVLPGHGPDLPDLSRTAREYLAHREQRLAQIRAALDELGPDATARQVVELVYADVDRALWWAAEVSVNAQLVYLREAVDRS
jgi:glyoxylase-like metal-dependent hydrolase (beta-lactamase superfamily II)